MWERGSVGVCVCVWERVCRSGRDCTSPKMHRLLCPIDMYEVEGECQHVSACEGEGKSVSVCVCVREGECVSLYKGAGDNVSARGRIECIIV